MTQFDDQKRAQPDLTRILLRGGLGDLRFGMTPDEARELLGEPDEASGPTPVDPRRYIDWKDDALYWSYEDWDLNLYFKDVAGRGECLVDLWTERLGVHLSGIPLMGVGIVQTRSALDRIGVKHQYTCVLKGVDYQYFSHGLVLHTFADAVDRIEWTILAESERDEDIDWSGRDRIG